MTNRGQTPKRESAAGRHRAAAATLGLIVLAVTSVTVGQGAAGPVANLFPDGSFESGKITTPIHWRSSSEIELQQGDAPDGEWVLHLPRGDKLGCTTHLLPVESNRRYSLRFMATVDGPGAIAPDLAIDEAGAVQRLRHTTGLAGWRVDFRHSDAPQKDVSRGYSPFYTQIIHSEWTEYREDFYVPPGADRLRIVFSNGSSENAVQVDDVRLVPVEGETLNINPDLAFGPYNFAGYNQAHQTRIVADADTYLDTAEGYIIGDPVPVRHQRYRFTFRARQVDSGARAGARLRFYDSAMEKLRETSSVRIRGTEWDEYVYAFVPPEDAAFVRIICGGGHFDWFRMDAAPEPTP